MKKALTVIIILVVIGLVIYLYETCKPLPRKSETPKTTKHTEHIQSNYQIVKHKYYTLAYSEENEQPAWVCYTLKRDQVGGSEPRSTKFVPDPMVSTQTACDADYLKSGYDKGHMVPAADMNWSADAMKETFYYSNVSPQIPSFNRGEWKKLEEKVREWAKEYDSVKVYAGPVFRDNIKKIGPDNVTVPGHYFKAVMIYKNSVYEGIGFIFPNKKINDSLKNYAVTIDSVENYVDLDFYGYLPENVQQKVESTFNLSVWGLDKSK